MTELNSCLTMCYIMYRTHLNNPEGIKGKSTGRSETSPVLADFDETKG